MVTNALAADTATAWESRLRPPGVPAAAVRTLPEALKAAPDAIVTAGGFRLVGSSIRVAGYVPSGRAVAMPSRLQDIINQDIINTCNVARYGRGRSVVGLIDSFHTDELVRGVMGLFINSSVS